MDKGKKIDQSPTKIELALKIDTAPLGKSDGLELKDGNPQDTWFAAGARNRLFLWKESTVSGQPCAESEVFLNAETKESAHSAPIRGLKLSTCGAFLVSGGDDKMVRLWDNITRKCLWSVLLPKKVSAVNFTVDSNHVIAADKFGEVYCLPVGRGLENVKANLLLAHFSSIVTCIASSPCGKFIATADRDRKIRITQISQASMSTRMHEIQSYCCGHLNYVLTVFFKSSTELVSCSGDGTVRLWNVITGKQLDCIELYQNKEVGCNVMCIVPSRSNNMFCALCDDKKVHVLKVLDNKIIGSGVIEVGGALVPIQAAINEQGYLFLACYNEAKGGGPYEASVHQVTPALKCDDENAAYTVSSAKCPWDKEKPVLLEEDEGYIILKVAPELRKHIFSQEERDYRKRNRTDVREKRIQ